MMNSKTWEQRSGQAGCCALRVGWRIPNNGQTPWNFWKNKMKNPRDLRVDFFSLNVSFLFVVFLFLKLNSGERNKKEERRERGQGQSKGHCPAIFPFSHYLALLLEEMRKFTCEGSVSHMWHSRGVPLIEVQANGFPHAAPVSLGHCACHISILELHKEISTLKIRISCGDQFNSV